MITEYDLLQVNPPMATATYTPVPHGVFINMIRENLDRNNLTITSARYEANMNFNQLFGVYDLLAGDGETTMNVGFRNSYDKSLAAGLVAGGTVIVCSNLMFRGEIKMHRKHSKHVFRELDSVIAGVIDTAVYQYEEILRDKDKMKSICLTEKEMAELAGRMFIEREMLNPTQMSKLKKEIRESKNFRGLTLWDMYNHTTEALKLSHPSEILSNHIKTHTFMMELV